MNVKVKHAPKRNFEYNGFELVDRYPNLWDFEQRYCTDCEKECEIPSMEILSCILKKLSNKKDKGDEKK
jgi:hypothetical protein